MNLFELDEATTEVKVNSPWIKLIPEFKDLFYTYGSTAKEIRFDNKNVLGRKRLTYIYFMLDFSSPIADWDEEKRHKEALTYAELTEADMNEQIRVALKKYEQLQYELCRPLKTYRAALKALEAMDTYFESIDFSSKDKQGKLLYTPNQYITNIASINKAYQELKKLKDQINEELKTTPTKVRGSADLGDRELKAVRVQKDNTNIDIENTTVPEETSKKWVELEDLIKPKS